jgi:hypothetical protein
MIWLPGHSGAGEAPTFQTPSYAPCVFDFRCLALLWNLNARRLTLKVAPLAASAVAEDGLAFAPFSV